MSTSTSICLNYVICFSIIIFIFITINHIISLKQTNLSFGYFDLKFSLRVLLIFWLIFLQFKPWVAYKRIAYKKACNQSDFLKSLNRNMSKIDSISNEIYILFDFTISLSLNDLHFLKKKIITIKNK